MKPLEPGMFARSLAGHDKDQLYVIIKVEEPYVYLADGRIRTLERLKKKKRIHIQPDYAKTEICDDKQIQKAIKLKNKENINV